MVNTRHLQGFPRACIWPSCRPPNPPTLCIKTTLRTASAWSSRTPACPSGQDHSWQSEAHLVPKRGNLERRLADLDHLCPNTMECLQGDQLRHPCVARSRPVACHKMAKIRAGLSKAVLVALDHRHLPTPTIWIPAALIASASSYMWPWRSTPSTGGVSSASPANPPADAAHSGPDSNPTRSGVFLITRRCHRLGRTARPSLQSPLSSHIARCSSWGSGSDLAVHQALLPSEPYLSAPCIYPPKFTVSPETGRL